MKILECFFLAVFLLTACNFHKGDKQQADSPSGGTIHISVDESFRPVIVQQLEMYKNTYPNTTIIADFKPEAACIKDLFKDSATRMIVVTRGLTPKEEKYFRDSLNYSPGWQQVATDAIVIIVNKSSNDTLFTFDGLKDQLTGANKKNVIVFDGLNATSTYRFVKDSILHDRPFDSSVVKAAHNSSEVIEYVANHPEAIGFIGISWIGNPEDTAQLRLLNTVKIARVQCEVCEGKPYVKPMSESIMTRRYPLVRGLFYVKKENYTGLASGFSNFLRNERGQLIFRRAYLGPVMDFDIRRIKINIK